MKKLILLSFSILFTLVVNAQIDIDKSKINPAYLKFLPSNANPKDLRPSDIPSEQVLKQMGFSDVELAEIMDFKNSRGVYSTAIQDTSKPKSHSLYETLGDTLDVDTVSYPQARIYGQDVFRNNELSFYQKALDAKAPENYKVGSGDEISISVWGYSEFSENLMVDERGYITPSSYGRIYVKGLTFKRMRSLLKSKFGSFLDMKNSEIDVTLSYSRVITVNIVGEVYNPGSYTIPAINTAFNALIAANGPNQLGTVRNIYIKRDGKTVDSLDVYQFLFNPNRSQDIYMQDGDYLFVPPAKYIVEVKGAVNRPYTYEAKTGESVANIIKYAGGYTANAFSDVITLKSIEYNSIKVNDVHNDHAKSTIVKNGDEIFVNTISNKISNVVTVKGSIGVAGDHEFIQGEHLLDLLNRAKCIDERTFYKVYIIRMNEDRTKSHIAVNLEAILVDSNHEDNILMQEYDIVRVLSVDDFDDEFSVSVLGAVRSGGEFDFGVGMTLQDALLQSGGLTQQAEGSRVEVSRIMDYDISSNKLKPKRAVVQTISIGEDLVLSTEAMDFELQPYDQIFVRENPEFEDAKNIVLTGEVKYPGTYTLLSKDEKISSVIKRAGGLTKFAYQDGLSMYRKFINKADNNELVVKERPAISKKLKESILLYPELAITYAEELKNSSSTNVVAEEIEDYIYATVYVDIEKALTSNKSKHNIVLAEGDSIVIPKIMDVVHVEGSLYNLEDNSITAPHFSSKRAHYYVNNFAGGYTKLNKRNATVVVYPNGVAKKSLNLWLFSISPKVKKGSTIKVVDKIEKIKNQKKPFDWNKALDNTITKLTAVLTLYLLIDRVTP
jgi:protein involved in polysaccharide export with SLBB domain